MMPGAVSALVAMVSGAVTVAAVETAGGHVLLLLGLRLRCPVLLRRRRGGTMPCPAAAVATVPSDAAGASGTLVHPNSYMNS